MPKALQLEMNWLDRAIGYVAPIWGARRMQSRYTMAAAQHMASGLVTGVRRLSGSGEGTLGNWNPRREQRLAENRSFDTITLERVVNRFLPKLLCT